jgi:hypothetical protein
MPKLGLDWSNDTVVGPYLNATNLDKITGAIEDANTFYPTGGTANAKTVTTANGNYSYQGNIILKIKIDADNTGAMTMNVDSNGPVDLLDFEGNAFVGGDLLTGQLYTFVMNGAGTAFLNAPSGGATIKSIQRGITNIPANAFNIQPSISAVDITKSIIRITFVINNGSDPDETIVYGKISSSTVITIGRGNNPAFASGDIYWEVIEYANVKSLQTGSKSVNVANAEQNVTVSAIDVSKSELVFSYRNSTATLDIDSSHMGGRIVDSTTITFQCGTTGGISEWQLLEFN